MKNSFLIFLIFSTGCMNNGVQSQPFAGSFSGQQPGINSSATITVKGSDLSGKFELNGRPGNIKGSSNGTNCQGILFDIEMQKNYAFTGAVSEDSLYMAIVFPELNNQVINLQMKRLARMPETEKINVDGERNNALVGLWRYTETFSSGSGDNYASLSTDYFMEFKADGTLYSWTGKSAGGTADMSLERNASSAEKAGWYTQDKTLFLVDPATGNKSSVLFYAEENRMMLHNGGAEKKILTRVR